MYYSEIIPDPDLTHCKGSEHAFRALFQDHYEALGHAAVLLGGRLVNAVREALGHHKPFTLRLRRQLLELRSPLFLAHAYDDKWGDEAGLALLELDDPIVPKICLIADGLEQAFQEAGVVGMRDTPAA